jgi:FkbM family methyltransferase
MLMPYGITVIFHRLKNGNKSVNERLINFRFTIFDEHKTNNYGYEGEDVLLRLFIQKPLSYKGFYIDIGAFHPVNLSNTKYFYDMGWNGINIDANPDSIAEFNNHRSRDINISCGVSDEYGELNYYCFGTVNTFDSVSGSNTFDKKRAEELGKKYNIKIREIKKIQMMPLNDILKKHLVEKQHIDFITIDIECFEMRVLQSFDFTKYAPDYFLIEYIHYQNKNFNKFKLSVLYNFMRSKGYNAVGKTRLTYIFKKEAPTGEL